MPAAELLVASYGARQHVRRNALQHLHQEITITRKLGSFTMEESLARLVQQGTIDRAEAIWPCGPRRGARRHPRPLSASSL